MAGRWSGCKKRTSTSYAVDAHSLPLQTLAELGLVGAVLLIAFLGGLWASTRAALARSRAAVAGPAAALVVYLAHAPLDWDWELPALTLFAAVLAGYVLALTGESRARSEDAGAAFTAADPGAPHVGRGANILPVP